MKGIERMGSMPQKVRPPSRKPWAVAWPESFSLRRMHDAVQIQGLGEPGILRLKDDPGQIVADLLHLPGLGRILREKGLPADRQERAANPASPWRR